MFIQRKSTARPSVGVVGRGRGRRIMANDAVDTTEVDVDIDDTNTVDDVTIDPEATDLLFEAEDVAELLAEATGQPVDVTVDDDYVEFAVGEDVYTVEAEGDEEVLEASSAKVLRNKRRIAASTNRVAGRVPQQPARRQMRNTGKPIRRISNGQ